MVPQNPSLNSLVQVLRSESERVVCCKLESALEPDKMVPEVELVPIGVQADMMELVHMLVPVLVLAHRMEPVHRSVPSVEVQEGEHKEPPVPIARGRSHLEPHNIEVYSN